MATDLLYNNVTLRNVLTLDFDQRPVRDKSDTDIWWWEVNLKVSTVMSVETFMDRYAHIGVFAGGVAPANLSQTIAHLQKLLGDDRKQLLYKIDGSTVVDVNAGVDFNNGPKVTGLKIHHVTPKAVRIDFSVQAAYYKCGTQGSYTDFPTDIISNRWSCADDIDEQMVTRRTWRGVLRMRNAIKNIHSFRGIVVPVLNRGFKRERMHFTGEANGLELGYEITDREMLGEAPPWPGFKMSGTHTESISQAASNPIGHVHLRIDGAKDSPKAMMIDRCMQIVSSKLQLTQNRRRRFVVQSISIIDHFGERVNAVEVDARVRHLDVADGDQLRIGAVVMAKMGKPLEIPEYDNAVADVRGPYGTATAAGLFACYLQHPCGNHKMPQLPDQPVDSEEETERGDGETSTDATYSVGGRDDVLDYEPELSEEHKEAIYEHYQIDSKILRKENRVQLPIAKSIQSNQDTSRTIRLAAPTCKRVIRVTGERVGDWPVLFRPVDFVDHNGIRHDLLTWEPTMRNKELSADGSTYTHALEAEYMYAMSRCPLDFEDIPTSSLPWDTSTSDDNRFPAASLMSPDSEKGIA